MRGVSKWALRVTSLVALVLVFSASAWADQPLPELPQARVSPPVGVTPQHRIAPPVGIAPPPEDGTEQARLGPPVGVTTQSRLQPPVGAPSPDHLSLFDTILFWLQSRLSVPNG